MDAKTATISKAARTFIKYCYMMPKDVLQKYVFDPSKHDLVCKLMEAYDVETPEELIYHLYEGTWFEN